MSSYRSSSFIRSSCFIATLAAIRQCRRERRVRRWQKGSCQKWGGTLCGEFPGGADESRTACHRDKRGRLVDLTDDDGFCSRIGRGELVGEVEFTLALSSGGGIGFGVGVVSPPEPPWGQAVHGNSLSGLLDSESSTPQPTWMTQSRPMLVLFSSKDSLDSPDSRFVSLVFGNRMDGVSGSTGMNRLKPDRGSLPSRYSLTF